MTGSRALGLACLALLAGCVAPPPGWLPLAFSTPVPVSLLYPSAEPVLAIAPDGTLYIQGVGFDQDGNGVSKVSRSTDGGRSWKDVTPPLEGQERSRAGFVAVADDGTVYAANVFGASLRIFRTDDRGVSWTSLDIPPQPPTAHRHWIAPRGDVVHVLVEGLPPGAVPALAGAPLPTSKVGGPAEGMWYVRSPDRGATWTQPFRIDERPNFAGQSNMVASADGMRLFVARYHEPSRDPAEHTYTTGEWYLLASEDAGASWARRAMFPLTARLASSLPSLALAGDGTLHFAWAQTVDGSSRVQLRSSTDGGATWSAAIDPAGSDGAQAMPWLAAGGEQLGLLWYHADERGEASATDAEWFVHYADLTGARTVRVTSAPVHRGNICAASLACAGAQDDHLLDHAWGAFAPDGAAHLAFPSTSWPRPSAFAFHARQETERTP